MRGEVLRTVTLQEHRYPVVQREFHRVRDEIPALNRDTFPLQPFGGPDANRIRSGFGVDSPAPVLSATAGSNTVRLFMKFSGNP